MKFKSNDQHHSHRYQNAKVLLSTLTELEYFYKNCQPDTGLQAIAKLSPEEKDAMYEILGSIYHICKNLKEYDNIWIKI